LGTPYVRLGGSDYVYLVKPSDVLQPGSIGLSATQRKLVKVSSGDMLPVEGFDASVIAQVSVVHAKIVPFSAKKLVHEEKEFDAKELTRHLSSRFSGHVLTVNQTILFEFIGSNYLLTVNDLMTNSGSIDPNDIQSVHTGLFGADAEVVFETQPGTGIKIVNQKAITT